MKIYTKVGDKGDTFLLGGTRVTKADLRLEAYGGIDELNASLGFVRAFVNSLKNQPNMSASCEDIDQQLAGIQNYLFTIGSHLACADEKLRAQLPPLSADPITALEQKIDDLTAHLPELKNFILPGGSVVGAGLHLARTICRRIERATVRYKKNQDPIDALIFQYLNRLSDFLFVLARYANQQQGIADIHWRKS